GRQAGLGAAGGDDFNAGGRLPVGRQAFTRAVGDAVRVDVRRAVVVAAVERARLIAGRGADELLEQRRGAGGGAAGAAAGHAVDRLVDQADLVGRVVAVGIVVRVTERPVQSQFLGERRIAQQRNFNFTEDLPHRVGAARDRGGREVVGVAV